MFNGIKFDGKFIEFFIFSLFTCINKEIQNENPKKENITKIIDWKTKVKNCYYFM